MSNHNQTQNQGSSASNHVNPRKLVIKPRGHRGHQSRGGPHHSNRSVPLTRPPPLHFPHPTTVLPGSFPQMIPQVHVPGNQNRSHRVYVDDDDVGFVIGGGGATIKRIKSQTGALVKYFPSGEDDNSGSGPSTGYFNIRGDERQIHLAKISIQELVIESKRRKIAQLTSHANSGGDFPSTSAQAFTPRSPTYAPSSPQIEINSPTYVPTHSPSSH